MTIETKFNIGQPVWHCVGVYEVPIQDFDNPMIIAPADDRWFGLSAKHLETCDLMPERFIKM